MEIRMSKGGKGQVRAYLRQEISNIIRQELKTYQARTKLQNELAQYQKLEKPLSHSISHDKLQTFRDRECSHSKKQYELFANRQKERQLRLQNFINQKKAKHQERFAEVEKSLKSVQIRHMAQTQEDCSMRLSRLEIFPDRSRQASVRHESRTLSSSRSQQDLISKAEKQRQQQLVSKYLGKVKRSELKVLQVEVQREKKREASLRKKVKCLVGQRQKQEQDTMQKVQREYEQRMAAFAISHSRVIQGRTSLLQSRAQQQQQARQKIEQRRELFNKQESKNYLHCGKENVLQQYRSALDLTLTHSNRHHNLVKMHAHRTQAQTAATMKLMADKIRRIRSLRYGQKLDHHSLQAVLGMLDPSDPDYAQMAQFLKSERRAFIEGMVRKEQEKSKFDKMKKMNKTLSKGN